MRRATVAVALVAAAACAQYGAPPGGERDERAPRVVETVPEPFAVVPGFSDDVIIRFDERLSEQGIEDAIMVSPQTGEVRIDRAGSELRVSLEGGWRAGQIYRIMIRPVVRDLFGNQRTEVAELVFSTGPPIPPTALAGELTERITGEAPEVGYVHAIRRADSVVYVALVADDGFFSAVNLPNGTYDVVGFVDANRNEQRDSTEASSPLRQVSLASDTLVLFLAALPFDTTAARVLTAAADSVRIAVTFDDALDPELPADSMQASMYTVPDSTRIANTYELLWPWEYEERLAAQRAAADTVAADSVTGRPTPLPPVDTAVTAADSAAPLPSREVIVVPRRRLAPGDYIVELRGARNINGIGNGGGSARVRVPEPPPPDSIQPPAVPADSVPPAVADSARLRRR